MKADKAKHIGVWQLIPGVRWTSRGGRGTEAASHDDQLPLLQRGDASHMALRRSATREEKQQLIGKNQHVMSVSGNSSTRASALAYLKLRSPRSSARRLLVARIESNQGLQKASPTTQGGRHVQCARFRVGVTILPAERLGWASPDLVNSVGRATRPSNKELTSVEHI